MLQQQTWKKKDFPQKNEYIIIHGTVSILFLNVLNISL